MLSISCDGHYSHLAVGMYLRAPVRTFRGKHFSGNRSSQGYCSPEELFHISCRLVLRRCVRHRAARRRQYRWWWWPKLFIRRYASLRKTKVLIHHLNASLVAGIFRRIHQNPVIKQDIGVQAHLCNIWTVARELRFPEEIPALDINQIKWTFIVSQKCIICTISNATKPHVGPFCKTGSIGMLIIVQHSFSLSKSSPILFFPAADGLCRRKNHRPPALTYLPACPLPAWPKYLTACPKTALIKDDVI